jgi:succinate-semialdehyde dehydrogenase/glutarate-semialdehyde dehydrogenase
MARQTSTKRGLQSTARKRQSSRHDVEPTPATRPVAGAFGRQGRERPAPRRLRPGGGIASVNPATGEVLERFAPLTDAQLEEKVERAAVAFRSYRATPIAARSAVLQRAAGILEEGRDEFAGLMTREMGKPIRAAVDEVLKCAWACRHYAEHAAALLADEPVVTETTRSVVRYAPLGPVLAVMPWNFPFWQVFRFAAPALIAGNAVLLKHASNVPQCALAIEDVLRRAGLADGVFQTLLIDAGRVGGLIEDARVAGVTLTGSDRAGQAVARQAGTALKKSVLELGGSDPFIVLPSADLDDAIETAVRSRIVNNGQSCIAAKRFIVAEAVAGAFERRLVRAFETLAVGDPMDAATAVGPLATADGLATLDAQVRRSVEAGAALLTGGRKLSRPGYYYAPTVLRDAPRGSPAYSEEMFGPVAALFRAADVADAIRLANDTPFGLGASVWTRDDAERERLADELDVGMVFVNAMVASDPRLPFGGVKRSGYGRELGRWGLQEFVNIKTVAVREGATAPPTAAVE